MWSNVDNGDAKCKGKITRHICHLSLQDLKNFISSNTLENQEQDCFVANKFNLEIDARPVQKLAQELSPFATSNLWDLYQMTNVTRGSIKLL